MAQIGSKAIINYEIQTKEIIQAGQYTIILLLRHRMTFITYFPDYIKTASFISSYFGLQMAINQLVVIIFNDPHTGDWWLYREDLAMPQVIGYWPKSLFTTLADSATLIRWGGFVTYSQKETGPPMGSGHYPDELEQKAAYIKNIELFNSDGKSCDLIDGMQSAYTDARKCYKVSALVDSSKFGLHDGFLFYFGGPPGCTK
ncbi:uncharacterized protein LOC109715510 isoform X7 [Ananas comosus]|uniref:Uncharacterized protein LOC109715510 isoform X7 n=1 Tax=Ananas comosus TaxID=4615 RepID=A0A6P5FRL8_ANACO|nr:uncharacterized protein LOC109715510 isoform X7 [Ananas comosus]